MREDGFQYSDPMLTDREKLQELASFACGCGRLTDQVAKHLQSYHELLSDELEDRPRALDFFSKALEDLSRISSLASLMEESGLGMVESERIPVRPMMNGIIDRCERLFARTGGISLNCEESLEVYGDVFQLQNIFFELMSDILKRLPVEKRLSVSVSEIHLSASEIEGMSLQCAPGRYVAIGVGECPDFQFDKGCLSLSEAMVTGRCSATNLARRAAQLGGVVRGGGEILLQSDGEDCLSVLLPAERRKHESDDEVSVPEEEGVATLPEEIPGGSETILLVDDEDMIWDVVSSMLMRLGYVVILAENGREAVEVYQNNPGGIDLVLMDMVMPEMNGREAFECLRKLDPEAKILLSSGYACEEDAQYVLSRGAVGFLRKPYSLKTLARVIRDIFDGGNER